MDVTKLVREIDDDSSKEEMRMCKHFPVDSHKKNGRHRVLIFAVDLLVAHTLSLKLDTVFEKLKCEAKLNIAFGFVLENIEGWSC